MASRITAAPSQVVAQSVEAASIRFNNLVYELRRRGEDVTVLSLGEAFFDIPLFDFTELPSSQVYHYTHSRGIPELREEIARYFAAAYQVHLDPQRELLPTAGSKAAIYMTLLSLLDPGDEVLIHEPAWVSYPEQVRLCYGIPVQISHDQSVFDFEKHITSRSKVIIINNPNNPSGYVYSERELAHLLDLARAHSLCVLSDEAYSDFLLPDDRFVSLARLDPDKDASVVVNSISKNFGMSGWRLGYVIAHSDLIDQILKVDQHLITCPPSILQFYVARYFERILEITRPQIREVLERRRLVVEHIQKIGMAALEGTATFYLFLSTLPSRLGSEEFATRLLEDHHVSVVPGLGYGRSCDSFVRISVGTEPLERITDAIDAIQKLARATS